jgi:hypothetical protein
MSSSSSSPRQDPVEINPITNLILPQAVLWHKKDNEDLNSSKISIKADPEPVHHQYHQHHQHQLPPPEIELSRFPPYPQNPARVPFNQTLAPPHQAPQLQYTNSQVYMCSYLYVHLCICTSI